MQKTATIVDLKQAGFDAGYWSDKTPAQRLEALEVLRSQKLTINGVRQKFQRVFKLVDHQ